ncbi:MAG: protein phosphatase 2C domain-containing protein [Trueperella sp.]|nr:protein phosphatase 2C domain-containing protein [Trueperella sp.]
MSVHLKYAAFSDIGLVRKSNQDAGYASANLLAVADGMGGAAGGDIASSVVISHLAQIDDTHQAEDLLPLLHATLDVAHAELIDRSQEKKELAGLGTTCVAILRTSNKLAMVHIGDSRAYLLRGGKLTQITHDHTLVQYLVDHGELSPEEAENHPKRNVIMRAIGDLPEPLELDESIREAVPGDRWLLCSDGLFGVVSYETIAETLLEYSDLDECGEQLISLALAGGAPDNVTVVLADVLEMGTESQSYDRGPIVVGSVAVDAHRPSRGGKSAAGQVSQLLAQRGATDTAPPVDNSARELASPRPRRAFARVAATLATIAVLVGMVLGGYAWSQTQYYVYPAQGKVAIYQGIPQTLGSFELSSVREVTDIEVADLAEVAQRRLDVPITRGSLREARNVVADLREHLVEPEVTEQDAEEQARQPLSASGGETGVTL